VCAPGRAEAEPRKVIAGQYRGKSGESPALCRSGKPLRGDEPECPHTVDRAPIQGATLRAQGAVRKSF